MSDEKVLQLPLHRASRNRGYLYLVGALLLLFLAAIQLVEANRLELEQQHRSQTPGSSTSAPASTEPSSAKPAPERPTSSE